MATHGPQAIVPLNYAGPHGMLAGGSMDLRFFHRLGASLLDRKPLCGGIRTEAWVGTFGPVPGMPPEQAAHAQLIIAWGNNVTWSNLHLMPVINQARRAGAKLVVVDPRRTKIAEQADLHLALRPGTDVVLAWALAAELERRGGLDRAFIERHVAGFEDYMEGARARSPFRRRRASAGVPETQIRQLTDWYQAASPAAISVGNGLERNQNGGSGIRAIFALPALAGKFGVAGRRAHQRRLLRVSQDAAPAAASGSRPSRHAHAQHRRHRPPPDRSRLRAAHQGPLHLQPQPADRASGPEPAAARSRRARISSSSALTWSMTDSLAYADVVLPACSHFEHDDLYAAYGQHWLQRAEPVIPRQGQALPNTEIFRRLAARFGFTDADFHGHRCRADGRGHRRRRSAPGRAASERAAHRARDWP